MDQYHEVLKGKVRRGTGAKKVKNRDKKLAHVGGTFVATKLGERKAKVVRVRGGNRKVKLQREEFINVSLGNEVKRVKIKRVVKSNNADFTRQSIITKGAILETDVGMVKVTSRPGQDGVLNGVLLKEEKS